MHKWLTILLCNWLLVATIEGHPQIIYGQFIEESSCNTTRDEWQRQETRPGVQWACLPAVGYSTVAVPKSDLREPSRPPR